MRILWFTNTPGLISGKKNQSGGWISSLQNHVEKSESITLGMVFYSDHQDKPFRQGSSHYYPVVRKGNTRFKRKMMQVAGHTESDENLERFLQIIEEFKPDIIHVHGTENPFGLILRQIDDIPVLISLQGILNVIVKKYFTGVDSYRFSDWRKNWDFFLAKNFSIFKKKADIEREILKNAAYVAGRTDWDRRVSGILAPEARYFHIDESLRPAFYNEIWTPPENGPVRIFSTISDQPYKGVHTLLEAAIELKASGFDFEWHVAGLDWGADMLRLFHREKELTELPLILRGRLNEEEIVGELLDSHFFVQVSQIENSSNSLAEAMMLGLPCIATDTGGTSSMLKDGIHGLLVPEGDAFCVAGTIRECAGNFDNMIQMGKAAREFALKRHSPESILDQLMNTYEEISGRNVMT